MMTGQILHAMRELHSRVADRIHVRLLWSEHDGRVTVAVADGSRTGARPVAGGAELVGLLAA